MRKDPFDLGGRRALVTGGGRGLGAAICRELVLRGADVVFTARPGGVGTQRVDGFVQELRALGTSVSAIDLDVRSVEDIDAAVDVAFERLGGIDILVNNAGTNVQQWALEVDEATWDEIVDANLKGLFFVSQAVARRVETIDAECAIVNIASQMGLVGWNRRAAYCASKGGVVNLTRALAVEWAQYGIRVNGVAPTFVHTPLADKMLEDEALHREVISRMPLGRIGEPEDVANAVVYLAGSASAMVTGHTLVVDGGWTAW